MEEVLNSFVYLRKEFIMYKLLQNDYNNICGGVMILKNVMFENFTKK